MDRLTEQYSRYLKLVFVVLASVYDRELPFVLVLWGFWKVKILMGNRLLLLFIVDVITFISEINVRFVDIDKLKSNSIIVRLSATFNTNVFTKNFCGIIKKLPPINLT